MSTTRQFITAFNAAFGEFEMMPYYLLAILAIVVAMLTTVVFAEAGATNSKAIFLGRLVALLGVLSIAWPLAVASLRAVSEVRAS